jgi:hypothetical protein
LEIFYELSVYEIGIRNFSVKVWFVEKGMVKRKKSKYFFTFYHIASEILKKMKSIESFLTKKCVAFIGQKLIFHLLPLQGC